MTDFTITPHTKVFGLGLSKTGTSSLGEALNQVGIKTIHYYSDEATCQEFQTSSYRLSILNDYQGIVDIPVVPYYAQLDKQYPGSKFIFTIRDKESWLKSIELHLKLLMEWWENFPDFKKFHEFISACLCGSIGFDREWFWYVYRTHQQNALQYFENCPRDLLLLDICRGEGWGKTLPVPGYGYSKWVFPACQRVDA
jgi:hypothetical protein